MAKRVRINFEICDRCENAFCKMEMRKHIASYQTFVALKNFMERGTVKDDCIYHLEHALHSGESR